MRLVGSIGNFLQNVKIILQKFQYHSKILSSILRSIKQYSIIEFTANIKIGGEGNKMSFWVPKQVTSVKQIILLTNNIMFYFQNDFFITIKSRNLFLLYL